MAFQPLPIQLAQSENEMCLFFSKVQIRQQYTIWNICRLINTDQSDYSLIDHKPILQLCSIVCL